MVTWSGDFFFTRIDKKAAPKINQTIVNTNDFGENTQGNKTIYAILQNRLVTQPMKKKVLIYVQ